MKRFWSVNVLVGKLTRNKNSKKKVFKGGQLFVFLIALILLSITTSLFVLTNKTDEARAAGNTYYVSPDGDGSNPKTWAGAWATLSAIQWGTGDNQVGAGDKLVIDEGRYMGPLTVGASGNPTTEISKDSYQTLRTESQTDLQNDGWIVITAGASDGTLDEKARIDGSVLEGKAAGQYEGTVDSGFSLTATKTYTYQYSTTQSINALFECTTTDLTQQNACTILTSVASVDLTESTTGSYYYDSAADLLYVHASDDSDISTSTYDYEGIITGGYPLNINDINGVVFDGGTSDSLRFSFGESSTANGVIKTNQNAENVIFRNLQMLYADSTGHYAHLLNNKLLIADSDIGKAVDNQSFSHSLISKDIYGFIVGNTIWDGYESHGNDTDPNPTQDYIVEDNTFKRELLTDASDFGLLKFTSFSINENGTLKINNNSFPDVQEFLETNTNMSVISIYDNQVANSGELIIEDNDIEATGFVSPGVEEREAIEIFPTASMPFNSITISDNTITGIGVSNYTYGIGIRNGADNLTIAGNTFNDNIKNINVYGSSLVQNLVISNNNINIDSSSSYVSAIYIPNNSCSGGYIIEDNNIITSPSVTTNRSITIYNASGNNIIRNNYLEGKMGSITYMSNTIDNSTSIYGNIFNGSDYGVRVYGVTDGEIDIYNNVFYKVKSGLNLDATSTNATTYNAINNIFNECSTEAVRDSSTNGKFGLNYNMYYGNTTDVVTEATTPTVKGAEDRTANPTFTNGSGSHSQASDFSLQSTSPAIDAGLSTGAPTTDYAGMQRYDDPDVTNTGGGTYKYYDIGAYEYVTPPDPTFTSFTHPSHTVWYSNPDVQMTLTSNGSPTTYYRYLVSQSASPSKSSVLSGTLSTSSTFTATIPSSGQWYVHVLAVNLDDGPSDNYDTYGVKIDMDGPNIYGPTAIYNNNSATISWTTDESATSRVDYGFTTNYASTVEDTNMVTDHSVGLTDLASCTQYHYRVYSKDAYGNDRFSTDNTFTTEGCSTPSDDSSSGSDESSSSTGSWRYFSTASAASSQTSTTESIPTTGTMDSEIRFDATNLFPGKDIKKYVWDFGDGTTDEGRVVTHKYTAPGRYTVKVTGFSTDGNEYEFEQTIDINPKEPSITNIKPTDDTDLIIEGTGYKGDTIYLSIHSTPLELESNVDESGYWSYTIAQASETLGEGTHTVSAIDSYKLADNTELKSSSSPDTKFKVYVDNGKLKVEMEKTSRWRTIAYILGGIIVLGLVVYAVRRKGRR